MKLQNFFTGIPEEWFSPFFNYIERCDAKNIALVDREFSQRVQDVFDTLYVLKTPLSTVKYQVCGDTVSLEKCYETLEKYRLRHLVMVLSSDLDNTFSCIEKRTQNLPTLSMLSLKVSFIFNHSYTMRSLMEAMKESGYSFGTVTFIPTMDQSDDFRGNLKMVQSNYMSLKKCLEDFPEVTTKAVYDFPSYKIMADATKSAIIDCKKFLEEDPNEWTETFRTTNIPNLVVGLNALEDILVLQRVVPEKTSVQNLLIMLPYKIEGYDNAGNYIERRYQNLFNLIQTKFTNVTELTISLLSYNEDVLVALFQKVIHPILGSFPDTKVFFVHDKLDMNLKIDNKNFQTILRAPTSPNEGYDEYSSDDYGDEFYGTEAMGFGDSFLPITDQENKEQLKIVALSDGNIRYLPQKPERDTEEYLQTLSIKLSEKKSLITDIQATSRLYLGLTMLTERFASLKTIFIKPRIFSSLSLTSIQNEFDNISFYINRVSRYVFKGNRLEKIVLNPDNLHVSLPNNTQLIKEELDRLKTTYGDFLEIKEPAIIRIDSTNMNDEEFCCDLMTRTSLNGLIFEASTKADFELFNTQFALFTGSPMNTSVKTVHLNLFENLLELDKENITMYYSEIASLLNHFINLKKVRFKLTHFEKDMKWHYDFLQEVMKQILKEQPQIAFSFHSDGTKFQLMMTDSGLKSSTLVPTKIVNSQNMTNDEFCVELMTSDSIDEVVFEISAFEEPRQFREQFKELFKEAPMCASVKIIHFNLFENANELCEKDLEGYYDDIVSLIRQFTSLKEVHFRAARLGLNPDQNYSSLVTTVEKILKNPQITLFLYQDKVADNMSFAHIKHENLMLK